MPTPIETIDLLRRKRGLTWYRLSRETGISAPTFTRWMQGKNTPDLESIRKLGDFFGVGVAGIVSGLDRSDLRKIEEDTANLRPAERVLLLAYRTDARFRRMVAPLLAECIGDPDLAVIFTRAAAADTTDPEDRNALKALVRNLRKRTQRARNHKP